MQKNIIAYIYRIDIYQMLLQKKIIGFFLLLLIDSELISIQNIFLPELIVFIKCIYQ